MNGRVTRTIRIDAQVAAILRERARPGETPNVVNRLELGMPERSDRRSDSLSPRTKRQA